MNNYLYYTIVILWIFGMFWFVREIVWGVRRVRFVCYLRKLSDKQLSDLYTERWLKLNNSMLKNRKKLMQYVEIMRELMRRDLYTGKIAH